MAGAWIMTEEGEFELSEPYATHALEARKAAMEAWVGAIAEYLSGVTRYTKDELSEQFVRYAKEYDASESEVVEAFVIRALEGEL